jgi:hypothetical protein
MAFTIKEGDLVYAADETLGFVKDVYVPERGDADDGWAAVEVPGVNALVYFTAADVATRDEGVPSVLLKLTYAQATSESRRRQPDPVARGQLKREDTPLLDVGRPEVRGTSDDEAGGWRNTTQPARPPNPDSVRDWSPAGDGQPPATNPS